MNNKCNNTPTKEAVMLNDALNSVGIETVLEHHDGHKCVDIYVPKAKTYIEVDGNRHYTSHHQIISDFERDHHSDDDGFHTLHIPNEAVHKHAIKIARALKKMVNF